MNKTVWYIIVLSVGYIEGYTHTPQNIENPSLYTTYTPYDHLSTEEQKQFEEIIQNLQMYTKKVHNCVAAFLNIMDNQSYQAHVNCFKKQLQFIQNYLKTYPDPETLQGKKVFRILKKIAVALEKSQNIMCQALDADYSNMFMGNLALGTTLAQIKNPINKQRSFINQQINVLHKEFLQTMQGNMLNHLTVLRILINTIFDYGSDKKYPEVLTILSHRLKH